MTDIPDWSPPTTKQLEEAIRASREERKAQPLRDTRNVITPEEFVSQLETRLSTLTRKAAEREVERARLHATATYGSRGDSVPFKLRHRIENLEKRAACVL